MTRIICPPENYQNPIEVGAGSVPAILEAAKRLNLVHRHDPTTDKLYLGQTDRAASTTPPPVAKPKLAAEPIFYSQRDSRIGDMAGRSCFSSTISMVVKELRPNALSDSPNADDEYLARVMEHAIPGNPNYNPSADEAVHRKVLKERFGIIGHYSQGFSWADVDKELAAGRLFAFGWLIWGHVSAPTGGGHWSLIFDKVGSSYRVHDPYGECDLVNGGYLHADGRARTYSAANLGRRWMVEGPGSGWGMHFALA